MIDRQVYQRLKIRDSRITLCGSTRFPEAFEYWNTQLTLAGNVVYSVAVIAHHSNVEGVLTSEEKRVLDDVHLKKIENSDAIFVVDVGGYIGESTFREIDHAESLGKVVYRLSEFTISDVKLDRLVA